MDRYTDGTNIRLSTNQIAELKGCEVKIIFRNKKRRKPEISCFVEITAINKNLSKKKKILEIVH